MGPKSPWGVRRMERRKSRRVILGRFGVAQRHKSLFLSTCGSKKARAVFFSWPKIHYIRLKRIFCLLSMSHFGFLHLEQIPAVALGLNLRRDTYLPLLSASKVPSQHRTTVTNCYDWSGPGVAEPYVMAVWDGISCCSCSLAYRMTATLNSLHWLNPRPQDHEITLPTVKQPPQLPHGPQLLVV